MSSRCRAVLLVLALSAFFATAGAALAAGGTVEGQVQDAQGKPMPGATITLLAAGGKGNHSQATDAQGSFHFEDLTSGVYTVTATLQGYAPVTCPGSRLLSGLTRRLEIKLAATGGGAASSCAPAAEPGS
ncbi:MAG: carboxypeptidase-like regulatory domain-containing protein [Thermoanaerobaculia bacterium]